jgi:cysteine-rich repeat protein
MTATTRAVTAATHAAGSSAGEEAVNRCASTPAMGARQAIRRGRPGPWLLGLLGLTLAACLEQPYRVCDTGIVCQLGDECAPGGDFCVPPHGCGNGQVDFGEVCDDGNRVSGDGCRQDCKSDETCGNGTRDQDETCDDQNRTSDDGCSRTCRLEHCGNWALDLGERCDDGNSDNGDDCSADCLSTEVCGNGYLDIVKGESCDDGNRVSDDGCSADCLDENCGNGVVDPGEGCDDGDTDNGDGCSADCKSDETCGNGILDFSVGEHCDDGNNASGDGCHADCRRSACGDGIVDDDVGEACDDGNSNDGDGCSTDCLPVERCDNGLLDPGELCDLRLDESCNAYCTSDLTCGNGYYDMGLELCDDGNEASGDGCSANCQLNEWCDDGNDVGGDGCSADGLFELGFVCTGVPSLCCADPASFALAGDASVDPDSNQVILTRDVSAQAGAAWFRTPVDLAGPVDVRFRIYLGNRDQGADGLAFVFHRDTRGLDALGTNGGGLGARDLSPAVFIEFDTLDNTQFGIPYDIACDHTAVFTGNGSVPIVSATCLADPYNVEDGKFHDIHVSWNPGAIPALQVSFDDDEIISLKEDIVAKYFGGDPGDIYFGMSAGTGALTNEHKLCLPEQIVVQKRERQ